MKPLNIVIPMEVTLLSKFSSDVRSLLLNVENCTHIKNILPTYKTDRLRDVNACLAVSVIGESFYFETDICSANKLFYANKLPLTTLQ